MTMVMMSYYHEAIAIRKDPHQYINQSIPLLPLSSLIVTSHWAHRWCVNGRSIMEKLSRPLLFDVYEDHQTRFMGDNYLILDGGDVVEVVLHNGWALNRVNEQRE